MRLSYNELLRENKRLKAEQTKIKDELYALVLAKGLKESYDSMITYTGLLSKYKTLQSDCASLIYSIEKDANGLGTQKIVLDFKRKYLQKEESQAV